MKTEHWTGEMPCSINGFRNFEFLNEITKEMFEKAMQCNTAEDLIAYAKTEGVDLTKEEAEAYLDELSECELKDGDLKHIAGGDFENGTCVPRDRY